MRGRPPPRPNPASPSTPDELDTDASLFRPEVDTDTDLSSLERHLFGAKVFDDEGEGVLEDPNDQHTMLHRNPSEADTVFQQGIGGGAEPPPKATQPPPDRRPETTAASGPGAIAAVGGVFAFSGAFVAAAFALVAMVLVVLVLYLRPTRSGGESPSAATGPAAQPAEVDTSVPIRFPATFAAGDTAPRDLEVAPLDALVTELQACPGPIRITGHADRRGSTTANDAIALGRAAEVRKILAARGFPLARLQIASVAALEPELEDDSPEARELNRRVVVQCE